MRVRAYIWVDAYRRRCEQHGIAVFIPRKGDMDAGAIYIRLNRLNGHSSLFIPAPQFLVEHGDRCWIGWRNAEAQPDNDIDVELARHCRMDPDLWIIECEDKLGRHLLDADLIEDPLR